MPRRNRARGVLGRANDGHFKSTVTPEERMIVSQWLSPVGGVGLMNAPMTNYYGILGAPGTPGGARITLSSPGGSMAPPPYSAVTTQAGITPVPDPYTQYNPHGPGQPQPMRFEGGAPQPIGFEGVAPQINPAPSLSNATLDYRLSTADGKLRPVGHTEDNGYESRGLYAVDHFPQPGRSTPDSMGYIHQSGRKQDRKKQDRGRRQDDKACCVVS